MPKNGWPNNAFTLNIYKEGYEFREVLIPSNFDLKKIFEIKLKKASSIKFTNSIKPPYYDSVGLLNSNGVLIQKPINYSDEYFKILYDDFTTGIATFSDLSLDEGTSSTHRLFISDIGNDRILSVKLGYYTERILPISK